MELHNLADHLPYNIWLDSNSNPSNNTGAVVGHDSYGNCVETSVVYQGNQALWHHDNYHPVRTVNGSGMDGHYADGIVDTKDLSVLLNDWLAERLWPDI